MYTQAQILDFLRENKPFFEREFSISKLGLFGSYARNEQTLKSDIDILFDFQEGTQNLFLKRFDFKEFVKKKLRTQKVDIVREKYIREYIKNEVLQQVIYV